MGNILNLLCGSEDQVVVHHDKLPQPKRQKTKYEQLQGKEEGIKQPFVTDAVIEAREDASAYSKKRTQFMQQSQDAYKNGDGAKAKQLSNEGKTLGRKMEEANAKAVNLILAPQNVYATGSIDLHGLFLKEAVKATNDFLDYWCAVGEQCHRDHVIIITGAGNHSKNKDGPVIRPKVVEIIKQRKLDYEIMHGNGAFTVYLVRRQ